MQDRPNPSNNKPSQSPLSYSNANSFTIASFGTYNACNDGAKAWENNVENKTNQYKNHSNSMKSKYELLLYDIPNKLNQAFLFVYLEIQ